MPVADLMPVIRASVSMIFVVSPDCALYWDVSASSTCIDMHIKQGEVIRGANDMHTSDNPTRS